MFCGSEFANLCLNENGEGECATDWENTGKLEECDGSGQDT